MSIERHILERTTALALTGVALTTLSLLGQGCGLAEPGTEAREIAEEVQERPRRESISPNEESAVASSIAADAPAGTVSQAAPLRAQPPQLAKISGVRRRSAAMGGHQNGETYARVQENRVVNASEDQRLTFSLDVDTASYTLMRRDLRSGTLPQPEAIRVEELLNFFDYGDEPPSGADDAPFAIHLESAPSPFGEGQHLLRVGVQAMEVPAAERPRANLVFLVDVSGSMSAANKLGLVQFSLTTLLNTLRPDDTIAIVTYAGADTIALQPTAVAQRGTILEAIQSLRSGGGTNGAAGIRTAYQLAGQRFQRGGINRVILCSDGDFNVGLTGDALIGMI